MQLSLESVRRILPDSVSANTLHDGYGNNFCQSVTKGTAPSHSFTMQTAQNPHASNQSQITNRISGQTYNASGELLAVNGVGLDHDGYGRNVRVTTGANQDKWWHSGAGADRVLVEKGSNGPVKISFYAGALMTECDVQYTNGGFKDLLQGGCTHRYYLPGMRVDQTRDIRDSKWDTTRKFPFGEDSLTSGAYTEDDHFASYRGAGSGAAVDYARNRSYAPTLGTFTSPDPWEGSLDLSVPRRSPKFAFGAKPILLAKVHVKFS